MRLAALKPAIGEGRGVAGGIVLSIPLHFLAFVIVGAIGQWIAPPDGYLLVVPFLAALGLAQWVYVGPTVWLLRRSGATGMAKGVGISGVAVTALMILGYGAAGLVSLRNYSEVRRIQQTQVDHPTDFISTDGVVTVVDDKHFEFRRVDDGTVVSLLTWPGLDYVFLKKNGGYEKRTREILQPDVRVSVDYSQERGKAPISASIVRVYEAGASR